MKENSQLVREEIRGIFVLGVLGTLLAIRDLFDVTLFGGLHLRSLVAFLMAYWSAYVLLMALGVSDDWIPSSVARECTNGARIAFIAGIAFQVGIIPGLMLDYVCEYLFPPLAVSPLLDAVVRVAGIILTLIVSVMILRLLLE